MDLPFSPRELGEVQTGGVTASLHLPLVLGCGPSAVPSSKAPLWTASPRTQASPLGLRPTSSQGRSLPVPSATFMLMTPSFPLTQMWLPCPCLPSSTQVALPVSQGQAHESQPLSQSPADLSLHLSLHPFLGKPGGLSCRPPGAGPRATHVSAS